MISKNPLSTLKRKKNNNKIVKYKTKVYLIQTQKMKENSNKHFQCNSKTYIQIQGLPMDYGLISTTYGSIRRNNYM